MSRSPKTGRPYLELGRAIAAARHRAGLSQWAFADLAGISRGYPGQIEGGLVRPEPETLRAIARALSVPYEHLAVIAGYSEPQPGPYPPDVERDIRPFARLPERVRRELLRLGAMLSSEVPASAEEIEERQRFLAAQQRARHKSQPEPDADAETERGGEHR